jgi:hypothetical protein
MKLYLPIFLVLSAVVLWQALVLRDPSDSRRDPPASPDAPARLGHSRSARLSADLPDLPNDPLSAKSHRRFLRAVIELDKPSDQARASERWADSLTTPEKLAAALDSLTSASPDERAELMRTFGPALFSQWGRIDPVGGLLTLSKLGLEEQWLLSGEDSFLLTREATPDPPFPKALIDAWADEDPDGLVAQLSRPDSILKREELGRDGLKLNAGEIFQQLVTRQDQAWAIRQLDRFTTDGAASPLLSKESMTTSVAQKLVTAQGGVAAALEVARALPDSPSKERIVMDLAASHFLNRVEDTIDPNAKEAELPTELKDEYLALLRNSDEAGRQQFGKTFKSSYFALDSLDSKRMSFLQFFELEDLGRQFKESN